jgi:SAM-dependent methyltransferase
MLATERLLTEQHFHDRQAEERAAYFANHRDKLFFEDAAYLDHETWIRPAFSLLGELSGKDVLDYGCGHGMASVVLARRGAIVSGFDLSPGYVSEATQRAEANGVHIDFRQADAEELPYADESFDAVWGSAILHHLDLERAGRELFRVLRPGGVAVFCEPWGENPVLNFARRWMPYPGKGRTPDERPLRADDLRPLQALFPRVEVYGHQFLGMLRRAVRRVPRPGGMLDRCDSVLLRRFSFLKKWCRYVVIEVRR